MVNLVHVGIFWRAFNVSFPCKVLSGTGVSAQTSSLPLNISLEGFVVQDLKLYRASQRQACANPEPWYLSSMNLCLDSYLYFGFGFGFGFLHKLLAIIIIIPLLTVI